jgi:peroxiredoxin family protein
MDHPDTAVTESAAAPEEMEQPVAEKATIVVQSGDFDKVQSAFIISNGALAMGMEVSLYFTFWGLMRLRKDSTLDSGPLSKMHMLIKRSMRKAGAVPLERLAKDFKELGGKIFACDMTMAIMGVKAEDLRQDLIEEYCSVGTYIEEARHSIITLFI